MTAATTSMVSWNGGEKGQIKRALFVHVLTVTAPSGGKEKKRGEGEGQRPARAAVAYQ